MTIVFSTDGTASTLYSELIDLREIGALEVHRRTNVSHNNALQRWEVRAWAVPNATLLYCHPLRSECLRWEEENAHALLG